MRILAVIPARLASVRLPNKPLVEIAGEPLIQRVYRGTVNCSFLDKTIVATDSKKIVDCIRQIGGEVAMTRNDHLTGTERVFEIVSKLEAKKDCYDIVLNVQGDEPFVNHEVLRQLIEPFLNDLQKKIAVTTLSQIITDPVEINNPNVVKVVVNFQKQALYFSRSPIPYERRDRQQKVNNHAYHKHIGLYGYRIDFIKKYVKMSQTSLEKTEKLEQLRILENNYKIHVAPTKHPLIDINTFADIQKAERMISKSQS